MPQAAADNTFVPSPHTPYRADCRGSACINCVPQPSRLPRRPARRLSWIKVVALDTRRLQAGPVCPWHPFSFGATQRQEIISILTFQPAGLIGLTWRSPNPRSSASTSCRSSVAAAPRSPTALIPDDEHLGVPRRVGYRSLLLSTKRIPSSALDRSLQHPYPLTRVPRSRGGNGNETHDHSR